MIRSSTKNHPSPDRRLREGMGAGLSIVLLPWAAEFDVEFTVDEGRSLASVAFISLSAVTHSVNMTQRYLILQFQPDGTSLAHVLAPPVAYAPPGPYMLVVIDSNGIPSVAKVIYLLE